MTAEIIHSHSLHPHNAVTESLQIVLANTYGLYLATHNYHWNVEGHQFVPLHTLFASQYEDIFKAIDGIAERIRALGEYAIPFGVDSIHKVSEMISNPLNKETDADARAVRMVHNLVTLNQAVIKSCEFTKEAATKAKDDETENLMVERITVHQKLIWMLNSILN